MRHLQRQLKQGADQRPAAASMGNDSVERFGGGDFNSRSVDAEASAP